MDNNAIANYHFVNRILSKITEKTRIKGDLGYSDKSIWHQVTVQKDNKT